jgi:hypothetical protein
MNEQGSTRTKKTRPRNTQFTTLNSVEILEKETELATESTE